MKRALIYVVDDDWAVAETLATALKLSGLDASAFRSGEEALAAFAEEIPSLVLTDVCMEGMSGVELASLLRGAYPEVDVVIFSGHSYTPELLKAAAAQGEFYPCIEKPQQTAILVAKVRRLLAKAEEVKSLGVSAEALAMPEPHA